MLKTRVVRAWAVLVFCLAACRAGGAAVKFNVLRQSGWEPFFAMSASPSGEGWSVKILDDEGSLRAEWRNGYGFAGAGTAPHDTFEELRGENFRLEYRPTATAETSVYSLRLDAPTWSSALLPAPRATVSGSRRAGEPVTVSWPVYEGGGNGTVTVRGVQPPSAELYRKRVEYASGGFVTDPLPAGFGEVLVSHVRDIPGAAPRLELISGPATDFRAGDESGGRSERGVLELAVDNVCGDARAGGAGGRGHGRGGFAGSAAG